MGSCSAANREECSQVQPNHTILALTLLPLVVCGSLAAEPQLPVAVAAALKQSADICREVAGKPDTKEAIKQVDLNGDGVEDYVLFEGGIVCEGAWSVYGDREKGVRIFVGDGKGDGKGDATQVFIDAVYGLKLEGEGSNTKLWLAVSGARCGRRAASDFASESFCDRTLVWNAAARKFDYAPISTVRMIE